MASHRQRSNDRFLFTPETPHFFKIILDDTIQEGKLVIPRKFVRKYGSDLQSPLVLTVPSGAIWKVEVSRCDGEVLLLNGWREFMEYYSIASGYFLVFKYEENSNFKVMIFDKCAMEIDYPYTTTENEEYSNNDDDDLAQFLDDNFPDSKRKAEAPVSCLRPCKLGRTDSRIDKTEKCLQEYVCSCQGLGEKLDSQAKNNGEDTSTCRRKSDNPVFQVAMQPSYICFRGWLCIPEAFARQYIIKMSGPVVLQTSDGKTWPARYCRKASDTNPEAKLFSGWSIFAGDNNLQAGDVCVFELIKSNEILLKVTIVRVDEVQVRGKSPARQYGCSRVKREKSPPVDINSVKSDGSSDDNAYDMPGRCHQKCPESEVPDRIVPLNRNERPTATERRRFESSNPSVVVERKEIPVFDINSEGSSDDAYAEPSRMPTLTLKGANGCRTNGVEDRNESPARKDRGKPVEQKGSPVADIDSDGSCDDDDACDVPRRMPTLTTEERATAIERARYFKSPNPFFDIVIRPSYASGKVGVRMPFKFFHKLVKQQREQNLTLQCNGRSWSVSLNIHHKDCKISRGWAAFARENSLKVGDVCTFELVDEEDLLLVVSILRN